MLLVFGKMFRRYSVLNVLLLMAFGIVALGCSSGTMSPMSVMHGESMECFNMFKDNSVISHKESGSASYLTLVLTLAVAFSSLSVLVSSAVAWMSYVRILFDVGNALIRCYDFLLRQFSEGILQPQIHS